MLLHLWPLLHLRLVITFVPSTGLPVLNFVKYPSGIKAPGQDWLNAEYLKGHPELTADVLTVVKGGWGVGPRSRFTENKLALPQFTGNKIGISRFRVFDTILRILWYLKVTPKHCLDRCLFNSSASSSTSRKRNPSKNMKRNDCMFCDRHAILLITVENTTRHNQNHGSQRIKYYFLIWRRIILENQASHLLTSKKEENKPFHISWDKNSWVIHESWKNHFTPSLLPLFAKVWNVERDKPWKTTLQ